MKSLSIITILATSLTTTPILSQSISSALRHDRGETIKGNPPTEIIEENTFYNATGKEIKRNEKKLNSNKRIVSEHRFNQEGKLEGRLTFTYDSSGTHILSRKADHWTNLGYTSETRSYAYDDNWHLINVTDKTDKGKVIMKWVFINDEKGNPTRLTSFDANGNPYGTELATYDYEANQAYIEVRDNQANLLSRDTLTIQDQFRSDPNYRYNEMNDVIESPKYINEYEYDEFGNWTTLKIFKKVNGKQKKDRLFKRKFVYDD